MINKPIALDSYCTTPWKHVVLNDEAFQDSAATAVSHGFFLAGAVDSLGAAS
jgi:hypothetical protein